jgi:phosphopantetheinyl transferase (holo-ACP synthase)
MPTLPITPLVTSIGNDLVDLKDYDTETNPRFKERILTEYELHELRRDSTPVWLYWAAKETGYKVIKKTIKDLKFIPKEFELDKNNKTIKYKDMVVACDWLITEQYVYLYGSSDNVKLGQIHNWISEIKDYEDKKEQSKLVRLLAKANISKLLKISEDSISFKNEPFIDETTVPKKSNYYPRLLIDGITSSHQISFTHHGRYIACAFWECGNQ